MPRSQGKKQNFYNYEVILDDEKTYYRTLNDLTNYLQCATLSAFRMINDTEYRMKKFRNNTLIINKVKKPIFNKVVTVEEIEIVY
tara:strand:+ start:2371 stop:2625 length:255 start_codon:yes stop_codon:yes gene_type:complete